MGRNLIETVMGAVVLIVAAFFLVFAYSQADLGAVKGYVVKAAFQSVGGLSNGADVRINGIKVGTVIDQVINPDNFDADVRLSVSPDIKLPDDSSATIDSSGLLGDKFVRLIPGHSKKTLPTDGSASLTNTKTYKSLEQMVGEIIFLATDNSSGGSKSAAPASGGAAAPNPDVNPAPLAPSQPASGGANKP
ncbi:MAG TPA: outer membrane lipid asymmetry maintenance protein MlaD [Magnetospirillaceae bacterium]|jgi:phospholipid/cholesterol/gamma-HCH transport system substrate-binding protein